MFFDDVQGIGRVALVAVLAYAAMILALRVSGKRTLSKMSAFDLIVTVALGSSLATVILSKTLPLAEGVVGFALLIGLQYAVTWSSVRFGVVRRLVRSEPKLLFHRGEMLEGAMRHERVLESEILAAVRGQGIASLVDVEAVVLETDGSFTVLRRSNTSGPSTLQDVARPSARG